MRTMHLEQLPSGSWRVTVSHNSIRRRGTAKTRGAAQILGARLLSDMGGETGADPTVADVIAAAMADAEQRVSPTTLADWQRVVARVPRDFLCRPVADVRPAHLDAFYRRLAAIGDDERRIWSAHRVKRLHVILSVAWKLAVRYEWATRNVCRDATPPSPPASDVRPPVDDAVRRLLAAAPANFALFLRLAATTGARRGELVALRWDAVDLDNRRLTIRRSFVEVDGKVIERPTKTGSKGQRVIGVGALAVAALRSLHAEQVETRMARGLGAPTWVFSDDAGETPWPPNNQSTVFKRLREKVGVSGVRLHDLRHYAATSMLADGVPVHVVAGRLGHASASTTQRVYAHFMPEQDRDAADALDARVGG